MATTATANNNPIKPTIKALRQLSPSGQGAVIALVRQLAEGEGITVELSGVLGLKSPAKGISLWLTKLRTARVNGGTGRGNPEANWSRIQAKGQ